MSVASLPRGLFPHVVVLTVSGNTSSVGSCLGMSAASLQRGFLPHAIRLAWSASVVLPFAMMHRLLLLSYDSSLASQPQALRASELGFSLSAFSFVEPASLETSRCQLAFFSQQARSQQDRRMAVVASRIQVVAVLQPLVPAPGLRAGPAMFVAKFLLRCPPKVPQQSLQQSGCACSSGASAEVIHTLAIRRICTAPLQFVCRASRV